MTPQEKQQISDVVSAIATNDINKSIVAIYPDTSTYDVQNIGNYTINEFVNLIQCTTDNFKRLLNGSNWRYYPVATMLLDNNQRSVFHEFNALNTNLNSKQYGNCIHSLTWLISYQIILGFWDSPNTEVIEEQKLKEAANKVKLQQEAVSAMLEKIKQSTTAIDALQKKLETLLAVKTQEFDVIAKTLSNATDQNNQISALLTKATETNGKISNIYTQADEKLKEINLTLKENRENYSALYTELGKTQIIATNLVEKLNEQDAEYTKGLNFIKEQESYIREKQKEINELTGFAAGVSLFHTFQARKNELDKPVKYWFWGLIAAAVITVIGVIVIFHVSPTDGSWSKLAINTLKSAPFFILLYFSIRQYSKERAIQEEYAFKSAVALTVNAFADKISEDGESGKDKLILSSVNRIYDLPTAMKGKSGSLFSFKSRVLAETLKNLTETIKEIKK